MKGSPTNPFCNPLNYGEIMNKRLLTPEELHNHPEFQIKEVKIAVKGYIPKKDYEKMEDEIWICGAKFRKDIIDLKYETFPYWSAPALTHSLSLLAISKYQHMTRCSNT